MERLDVAVLLQGAGPDELEADAQNGSGLSELFASVLGSVVALECQFGAVRPCRGDGLDQRLDGDIGGGQGVEPVGDPLPGEDVQDVEAVTPAVDRTAPDVGDIRLPDPVGRAALIGIQRALAQSRSCAGRLQPIRR